MKINFTRTTQILLNTEGKIGVPKEQLIEEKLSALSPFDEVFLPAQQKIVIIIIIINQGEGRLKGLYNLSTPFNHLCLPDRCSYHFRKTSNAYCDNLQITESSDQRVIWEEAKWYPCIGHNFT